MILPVEQEPGFILHSRGFTDSRILIDLLTAHHGKVRAVYRLPKRAKSTVIKPQPFTPLLIGYTGGGELKNITTVESTGLAVLTGGTALFCGIYLNELLQKLLPVEMECAGLFRAYQMVLVKLAHADTGSEDIPLREFELQLLAELGYRVVFSSDVLGEPLANDSGQFYRFDPEQGFSPVARQPEGRAPLFSGRTLAAIACQDWRDPTTRQSAKQLCRLALEQLLDGRELKSRELFRSS